MLNFSIKQDTMSVAPFYSLMRRVVFLGLSMSAFLIAFLPLNVGAVGLNQLAASTFLGGIANESSIKDVFVDTDAVYILGSTESQTFSSATITPKRGFKGISDAFVAKMSPDLKQLLAYTYIGGTGNDRANAFAVKDGYVYVTGVTMSNDLLSNIVTSKITSLQGYSDGFLIVLTKNLDITNGMYWGGSGEDDVSGIVLNDTAIYLTGETGSSDLPVKNAAYPQYQGGFRDFYLSSFSLNALDLLNSTYIGGSGNDRFPLIINDVQNNIYIFGETTSADIPKVVVGGNITPGAPDAVIVKLSPQNLHINSRYIGGDNTETAEGIIFDGSGNLYLGGGTMSLNFPVTTDAYQVAHGGYKSEWGVFDHDGYLVKLSTDLSQIKYASYLGGWGWESIGDLGLDAMGILHVSGFSQSFNFPTTGGSYDETINSVAGSGTSDIFLTSFSADLKSIQASTFLGGVQSEYAPKMAFAGNGNLYIVGQTESVDFPVTADVFDTTFNGGTSDVFVSVFGSAPLGGIIPIKGSSPMTKQGDPLIFSLPSLNLDQLESRFLDINTQSLTFVSPSVVYQNNEETKLMYSSNSLLSGLYRLQIVHKNTLQVVAESDIFEIQPENIVYLINSDVSSVYSGNNLVVNVYPGLYAYDKMQSGTYKLQWYNSSGKSVFPTLVSGPTKEFSLFLPYTYNTSGLPAGTYTVQLRDVSSRSYTILASTKISVLSGGRR